MTQPISHLSGITLPGLSSAAAAPGAPGEFGKILEGAVSTVDSAQKGAASSIQNFLTGEDEDIHSAVLAVQKAEMTFDLGLQVRNKVVSAYQDIMKMQM
jgi:flagellar hook-basal body complex protein FliE